MSMSMPIAFFGTAGGKSTRCSITPLSSCVRCAQARLPRDATDMSPLTPYRLHRPEFNGHN
jgi:hypothetical protein